MTFWQSRISANAFLGGLIAAFALGAAPDPAAAQPSAESRKVARQIDSDPGYCWSMKTGSDRTVITSEKMRQKVLANPKELEFSSSRTFGVSISFRNAAGQGEFWERVACPPKQTPRDERYVAGQFELAAGILFGHTGNNQNATVDTSFGSSASGSVMDSTNAVGFDARLRYAGEFAGFRVPQDWGARQIAAAARPSVFVGYRFQSYTNAKGELVINFHPTPGNDTFLSYRPDSSHTFYGGVGIPIFGAGVIQGIDAAAIDLYTGYRHVTGDITGSTNETGGGGIVNPLGGKFNQNGWVFGGEFNLRTNVFVVPIILGVGADVAKLDGGTIFNRSSLGFGYNTVLPDRTETTVYGKLAIPFSLPSFNAPPPPPPPP